MKRIINILLILLLGTPFAAFAQSTGTHGASNQFSEPIYFRIGQSAIELDFEGNRDRMEILLSRLREVLSDPSYVVTRVVVTGTASPDGAEEVNNTLAGLRAKQLADYLLQQTDLPAGKLEIINGGENWAGLRVMIEESKMPYKSVMLDFMDRYPLNRDKRKRSMQFYANSEPWQWMYKHFFPVLRMGAGGTQGYPELNLLSLRNWERMREIIPTLPVNANVRKQMLNVLDTERDGVRRLAQLHDLCAPETYNILQRKLFATLLSEPSLLSQDNWSMLWERINSSRLPQRDQILRIIDNVPILEGREQQLRALDGGKTYQTLLAAYFPGLLTADRPLQLDPFRTVSDTMTLGAANWQQLARMIEASDMQGRDLALAIIRGSANLSTREKLLQQLDNGNTYKYISEVFFPELLYGLSAAAQENWAILTGEIEASYIPYKDEILHIIATTPAGQEREEAIRALDNGENWQRLSKMLLPKMLAGTETVATGSGVRVYYEPSPMARARATAMKCRQVTQAEIPEATTTEEKPVALQPSHTPILALKTDLLLWGSVMPDFEMGTWTPNLSLEFYFAHRWSLQAGYAYSAWSSLTGSKSLYSVSGANLGVRFWLGKASHFKGIYLGLYGKYGQYDIQSDAVTGNTGTFYNGGMGIGYLLPISPRWAFELELLGGYRSATDDTYDIEDGHFYYKQQTTVNKLAPQVRLQFMYRLGKPKK